jgi:DNA-directed RNA polymerase specialized sigma24 family protein
MSVLQSRLNARYHACATKQTPPLVRQVEVSEAEDSCSEDVRSGLEQLYRGRYGDYVRVATAIVGDEFSAIDVVQEAFARALAGSDSFRESGPLAAWVWRIVINAARSHLRTASARLNGDAEPIGTPVAPLGEGGEMRHHLASLPERQRLVVFLRYYADLSYRSIAEALDIEVGTVSASLNAAHRRLRKLVEEVGHESA